MYNETLSKVVPSFGTPYLGETAILYLALILASFTVMDRKAGLTKVLSHVVVLACGVSFLFECALLFEFGGDVARNWGFVWVVQAQAGTVLSWLTNLDLFFVSAVLLVLYFSTVKRLAR